MKAILFTLFLFSPFLAAQDKLPSSSAKEGLPLWEYHVLTANHAADEKERIAELGLEGWELVSVLFVDGLMAKPEGNRPFAKHPPHLRYYFKRLKSK